MIFLLALSCTIFSAFIDQGGHLSLFLQQVKIPLLIVVNSLIFLDDTPFNLGSFSLFPK